jgi:uncharacterized protein YceH (UPF0502 family)
MATEATLNAVEVRVLGAMVEKQIATPEYYPLSLNALTNACNQKSNRNPVVSFDEKTVVRALDSLREKKLVWVFKGVDSRVPKYGHIFTEAFELSDKELAAMCVLMLRGPQTVGEIRGRAGNLYNFEGLEDTEAALESLMAKDPQPLVARLPRQAGMKEHRYAHLLSGPVEIEEQEVSVKPEPAAIEVRMENERITRLEEEVAALRRDLAELGQRFDEFKKQFE